jgi:hypothetical protein
LNFLGQKAFKDAFFQDQDEDTLSIQQETFDTSAYHQYRQEEIKEQQQQNPPNLSYQQNPPILLSNCQSSIKTKEIIDNIEIVGYISAS